MAGSGSVIRLRRQSKPNLGVPVDPSHSLSQGMVLALPMNESTGKIALDASGNQNNGVFGTSPTWANGRFGPAVNLPGTSGGFLNCGNAPLLQFASAFTIFVRCSVTSVTNSQYVVSYGGTGTQSQWRIRIVTSTSIEGVISSGGSGATATGTVPSIPLNTPLTFAMSRDITGAFSLYYQGKAIASNTKVGAVSFTAGLFIGTGSAGTTGVFNVGPQDCAFAWSRSLSPGEVSAMHENPWQVFAPITLAASSNVFTGTTTLSRQSTFSATAHSPYGGTTVLSRQATFSGSGTSPYRGTTTLSSHPTIASSATLPFTGIAAFGVVRRVSKPNPGVGINWSHHLAAGLAIALPMNERYAATVNDATGKGGNGTLGTAITWTDGRYGSAIRSPNTGNSTNAVNVANQPSIQFGTGPFTAFVRFRSDNFAGIQYLAAYGGTTANSFYIRLNSNVQIVGSVGSNNVTSTVPAIAVNSWHTCMLVREVDNSQNLYFDGQRIGTLSGSVLSVTSTSSLQLCFDPTLSTRNLNGQEDVYLSWNRPLSASEASAVHLNPWQMFAPTPILKRAVAVVYRGTTTLSKHPIVPSSVPPLAYWKMDGLSGSIAIDEAGSYPASVVGDVAASATVPTTSFADSGSFNFNQTLGTGLLSTNITLPSQWTIAMWLNPRTFGATVWANLGANDSGDGLYINNSHVAVYYAIAGSGKQLAGGAITSGTWQHLAYTFNAGTITIYINGTSINSGTAFSNFILTAIGSDSTSEPFFGLLDDYRVYPTALTPTQIATLAAGGDFPLNMTGLLTPGYHGTTTVTSSHAAVSSTAHFVPKYTGTTTVSATHATVSSAAQFIAQRSGTATISRHPTIAAAGGTATFFRGTMTKSTAQTFAATAHSVVPAFQGAGTVSRHPTVSGTAQFVIPTYAGTSTISRHPSIASTAHFTPPTLTGHLNLFLMGSPAPSFSGTTTLSVVGSTPGLGGMVSFVRLFATGWDNPPHEAMNLFTSGFYGPGGTSEVMNLWTSGAHATAFASATLFALNLASRQDASVQMFVQGPQGLDGGLSLDDSMNLFVARGPQAGMTLYVQNNGIGQSVPLFVSGTPRFTGQATLFVAGLGGNVNSSVTLVVPQVTSATAASSQVTLAMPGVVGVIPGNVSMYTHGWTP